MPSSLDPLRQAEITPVISPMMIAMAVPSVTIGIVFFRSCLRFSNTGCWFVKEMPMFP